MGGCHRDFPQKTTVKLENITATTVITSARVSMEKRVHFACKLAVAAVQTVFLVADLAREANRGHGNYKWQRSGGDLSRQ